MRLKISCLKRISQGHTVSKRQNRSCPSAGSCTHPQVAEFTVYSFYLILSHQKHTTACFWFKKMLETYYKIIIFLLFFKCLHVFSLVLFLKDNFNFISPILLLYLYIVFLFSGLAKHSSLLYQCLTLTDTLISTICQLFYKNDNLEWLHIPSF